MFSDLFSSIRLQRVSPLFSDLVGLRLTLRYAQLYIVLFSLRHREGHRLMGVLSEYWFTFLFTVLIKFY